jgi:hypothetical protein
VIAGLALLSGGGFLLSRLNLGNRPQPDPPAVRQVDSTGKIRVGMPMHEVAKVLDAEVGREPAAPNSLAARLPEGTKKSGELTWARDGRVLSIEFEEGRVVAIDEETVPPGSRTTEDLHFDP